MWLMVSDLSGSYYGRHPPKQFLAPLSLGLVSPDPHQALGVDKLRAN